MVLLPWTYCSKPLAVASQNFVTVFHGSFSYMKREERVRSLIMQWTKPRTDWTPGVSNPFPVPPPDMIKFMMQIQTLAVSHIEKLQCNYSQICKERVLLPSYSEITLI